MYTKNASLQIVVRLSGAHFYGISGTYLMNLNDFSFITQEKAPLLSVARLSGAHFLGISGAYLENLHDLSFCIQKKASLLFVMRFLKHTIRAHPVLIWES